MRRRGDARRLARAVANQSRYRAGALSKEIIDAHAKKLPLAGASWHDLPMRPGVGQWTLDLPLAEIGYFQAKGYLLDPQGWQHWPEGPDVGISIHPDGARTGNTIYCAFTRMFGDSLTAVRTTDEKREKLFASWDKLGYSVIPPSGKFRDLIRQLPHIVNTLGCRILHLLPVNPTPTVYARFGRFGSPYASLDLTGIDPALVEFDRRTTGVDQFRELTYATHLKGGRVFLDMVINHTGWGSRLQEQHPEWFLRGPDGLVGNPGAWGVTWEDLVELEHTHVALWDYVAEAFLVWCHRGVDGFRCDAGYQVPAPAWQYITTRVRREFPETIFLLEGLGGSWEITERLLTEGGMQWAYSELFQNYSGPQVAGYLDHSFKQSGRAGLLVHYSETHDNERLAARGRAWSLLRNRLCALTSVSGGYGFTCGVEWLAPERVNVHSSRSLAWGNPDNLVPELAQLNRLLNEHPCFFEGAKCTRLSPVDSPVFALHRVSEEDENSVLVLANNDAEHPQKFALSADAARSLGNLQFDLTGQKPPPVKPLKDGGIEFNLDAGACHCLSADAQPRGLSGDEYRRARAQAAWALTALGQALPIEQIPAFNWRDLGRIVNENPAAFLATCSHSNPNETRLDLERLLASPAPVSLLKYPPVVLWSLADRRRIVPVPPGHWLLIQDSSPFRATLRATGGNPSQHVQCIAVRAGHAAYFAPGQSAGDALLTLERYASEDRQVEAPIRFLTAGPILDAGGTESLLSFKPDMFRRVATVPNETKSEHEAECDRAQPLVLLTNGIGGMARLCVDLGAITSKYDSLLGVPISIPACRWTASIFAKRARGLDQRRRLYHAAGFAQSRRIRAGAARPRAFPRLRGRRPDGGNPNDRGHALRTQHDAPALQPPDEQSLLRQTVARSK